MDGMGQGSTSDGWQDVRRSGFARRVALAEARGRLAGLLRPTGTERVALGQAAGRVTATAVVAPRHVPAHSVALIDGYALSAAATYGADTYNPLPIAGAVEVVAGMQMPPDTDVVLPYAALTDTQGAIEVVEPAAPGQGIAAVGSFWREGGIVLPAGRPLSGLDLVCAAAAGVAEVEVVRQPEVRLLVRGDKSGMPVPDFLSELISRDGGATLADVSDLRSTLREIGAADLVLVVGRTGCGGDDDSAPLLADVGTVTVHGLALAPGGSAGCGAVDGVPVVLLPGDPLACLAAYELLAGPALRRLAGLPEALPHPFRERRLGGKIASQVGTTELWLVRDAGDEVVPLAPPERATLAHAAQASGFVLVALESEGHDAGETVLVHLLRPGP